MNRKTGRASIAVFAVLLSVASTRSAQAQWPASAIGVVEYDTKQTLLLLGGVSASPGGVGVHPLIGVQAYYLTFDVANGRTNAFTVRPYVGLRNGYDGGSMSATVGYAFANRETSVACCVAGADQGDGVVVSGGLEHWGSSSASPAFQLLGSYNFGTEGVWTRGRATTRISEGGGSQTRFGGEVAFLHGKSYQAVQPGLVLEFHNEQGRVFGLGAGMKFFDGAGSAVYFSAQAFLPLFR